MDDKHRRRLWIVDRLPQHKEIRNYGRHVSRFFYTQRQSLLTGWLLLVIVMLLFGIVSHLQPPRVSTPPHGVTVIDYSTFVGQVKANNVLAVILQGNDIHGLLANPLPGNRTPSATLKAKTSRTYMADIAAWSQYVSAGYPARLYPPAHAFSQSQASLPPSPDSRRAIYTRLPGSGDANLSPLLFSNHVVVSTLPTAQPSTWFGWLWKSIALLFGVLIMSQAMTSRPTMRSSLSRGDRMAQLEKSYVRRFEPAKETKKRRRKAEKTDTSPLVAAKAQGSLEPPVTFADVAGIDEVRVELEEIVHFLSSPERFNRLGARIPRGALLVGPPGTGKTLLAKAVAGEAGVPFFSISASEFVEVFVGVGAKRVRKLFEEARRSAPCVIFIDELDAVGRQRSMRITGNDERDQTLNQLLVELDGFGNRTAVVALAATNRVDILDKALLRPGRFDRHVMISLPDRAGREAILKVHTHRTPLHKDVSLERLSRLTTGMSGADLANLVNEAALSAARQNLEHLTLESFEQALARVQLGAVRPLVISEAEQRIIAYHEGGHALVAYHLPQADTVNRVTILPRGQSLGVTQFTTEEDRYTYSREGLMARITVGLGGRVAEELAFGPEHVTTGAENDLQVVTDLARRMVTRWGMSEQVGVIFADYEPGGMSLNMGRLDPDTLPSKARSLVADVDGRLLLNGDDLPPRHYTYAINTPTVCNRSTILATLVDSEVQRILKEGYVIARAVLSEHYAQLSLLADALMEHEQLDRAQFEGLLQIDSNTRI
jgi:ATP-dependent metalloprotease FtsH